MEFEKPEGSPSESESANVNVDITANSSEAVLGEYEKRPYPAEDERVLSDRRLKLLNLKWWQIVGRDSETLPPNPRILVAGCGTGNEAFNVARAFPKAEVIGVDFSPRSIEIANKWKGPSELENVSFFQADLTDPELPSKLGGKFDLISCHGVASYIPELGKALKNFSELLKDDGSVYLGVNGKTHSSTRYREVLSEFDLQVDEMKEPKRGRRVIHLVDHLTGVGDRGVARNSDSYIASDVFGPLIMNNSLGEWIERAEQNGLKFLSSVQSAAVLARIPGHALPDLVMEKDTAAVHTIADTCRPAAFHRIVLGKGSRRLPSFKSKDRDDLMQWRPLAGAFDRKKIPAQAKPLNRQGQITLNIPGLHKDLKLNVTAYILEFLRQSDGKKSVQEVMDSIDFKMEPDRVALFLARLYLMGVLHLCAPKK